MDQNTVDCAACERLAELIQRGIETGKLIESRSTLFLEKNSNGHGHRAQLLAYAFVGAVGSLKAAIEKLEELGPWTIACDVVMPDIPLEVRRMASTAFWSSVPVERVAELLRSDPTKLLPGAPRQTTTLW